MKRPTTAGAACRRAQRPATPAQRPGPHRQLPNEGVAKNGELLGPKVKAQLALEARGHVPNADDGSAFVRFGTDTELLIYVSSQLLFLRAEHLDVGFMLSGFRRRQIKEVLHPFEAKCSCRPDEHIPSMLH